MNTKREYFETLRDLVITWDVENTIELVAFIEKEIEALDKRAANAKKYASKKKTETDELTELANSILQTSGEVMTIPQIVAAALEQNPNCGATAQKMVHRLNKLVEAKLVTKDQVSIKENGKPARKINSYAAIIFEE